MIEPVIEPFDEDVARATDQGAGAYRPGVGIMLVNRDGRVFVGQRFDSVVEAWQMPQGGIDKGRSRGTRRCASWARRRACPRISWSASARPKAGFATTCPRSCGGCCGRGVPWQRQKWYALRFLGTTTTVNIATHEPEFRDWKWGGLDELADLIGPVKRELYAALIAELRPVIGAAD
jgi:putative (di)nucleoside polyphosphate hydrolase